MLSKAMYLVDIIVNNNCDVSKVAKRKNQVKANANT